MVSTLRFGLSDPNSNFRPSNFVLRLLLISGWLGVIMKVECFVPSTLPQKALRFSCFPHPSKTNICCDLMWFIYPFYGAWKIQLWICCVCCRRILQHIRDLFKARSAKFEKAVTLASTYKENGAKWLNVVYILPQCEKLRAWLYEPGCFGVPR